ncbi:hypothetical protein Q3G72_009769 [Acer saccharum]|nr:hypothetical protein Q3G72_009769 [Acer saccharum]
MRTESAAAYRWLFEKDPMHWSMAFFKDTAMCDMLCNNMCPKVFKFVEKLKLESSIYHSEYSGNSKFQVRGYADEQYVVDIEKRICACNKWQLIGIPCIHGMSALMSSKETLFTSCTRKKAFLGLKLL